MSMLIRLRRRFLVNRILSMKLVDIIRFPIGWRKYTRVKHIALLAIIILASIYFGAFHHLFEKNYYYDFEYPLEGDINKYVSQLMAGTQPDVPPINQYSYPFIIPNKNKCKNIDKSSERIRLLLIVKSAVKNFDQRNAIRQSWGWEKRFSDVIIRRVFNLGSVLDDPFTQQKVDDEQRKFGDIIQGKFVDTYFNNTIKTMMGFRWAVENCPNTEFVMFVDDDMYVSIKNVLRFVRYPQEYPMYLEQNIMQPLKKTQNRFDLNEGPPDFFAGYRFFSAPLRHMSSKWFISLEEYPYHMYPPYITAGAFIMPFQTLRRMYFTSMYTQHFRFDDIYLGLVAKKAEIAPLHNENFYFWKKSYNPQGYRFVIACHGYDNSRELSKVWAEQRSLGNA